MPDYPKNTIRHVAGNLGDDPERIQWDEGSFIAFRVAVTRDYDDDAAPRWYGVTVGKDSLGKAVMKKLHKGSRVVCEGIPSTKEGDNGKTFHNFKAFRVGVVEYLGLRANVPDDDFDDDDDEDEDDEDWGDDL